MIGVQSFFHETIPLQDKNGKVAKTRGKFRFATRNVVVAKGAVLGGAGFTILLPWLAEPEIRAGHLQQLLPRWEGKPNSLSVGMLPTKHKQLKVSLFIEEILQGLQEFSGLILKPTIGF
jgi:DNA-binding transcriptional LysR family regulator